MSDLERGLRELGAHIEYPPERDLAPAVRARIDRGAGYMGARRPARRAVALAAAVLVIAVSAPLIALPGVRSAVADWLGVGGVRIRTGGPTPTPAGPSLDLGRPVSLEEGRAEVDFDVVVPGELGPPDAVFFEADVPGGQVVLAYRAGRGLPAAPNSEYGALVTQFEGSVGDVVVKKTVVGDSGTKVSPLRVDGSRGFWISGRPHFVTYLDRNGRPRQETVRLVGNVLLWERDGVTLRIESALSRRSALDVARSLR